MKKLFVFALFLACLPSARAEVQTMSDPGAAGLAQMLAGHALFCGPAGASQEAKGFYPLKITAKDLGHGKTELSALTADPKVEFGYGGSAFDAVERTKTWTIISCGDDGRRHLMLMNYDPSWLEPSAGSFCDPAKLKKGVVDGNFAGIISEIWDAGNISSEGVQCCVQ